MRGSCSVASIMPVHRQLVHMTLPVPLHGVHLHAVIVLGSTMPTPEQTAHARYPLPCEDRSHIIIPAHPPRAT
jgi:hypothetical protein